jgi:peptide/nickel transport system substrate-binding protein
MRLRLLSFCCVLPSVACFGDTANTADGDTGGTLVILSPAGRDPLLPPLVSEQVARQVTDNLYEPLAEIGPAMNTVGDAGFEPRLAKSWQWSADSMSIAFSIDPEARWHDGQPVRAADVKFSLDVLKDPATASLNMETVANVDSIAVRDSLTAVAWFKQRTPEQFYDLVYQLRIIPAHVLKDIPRDKLRTSEVVNRPIGTGRFRFVRWDPGVRIELIADTAHYRARARLDRVIWAFTPDANAAITQLFSGQGDFYEALPAELLPRIDSSGQLKAFRYPGLNYAFMGFNHKDPKRLTQPHPIFGDVRVRRALSMALDREAMLKNYFDTLGVLGSGPYPRAFADTTVKLPPFDRAAAAALLDSAGWRMGQNGVRSRAGKELAFRIMVPNSSRPRLRYAVLVQEQLKNVGARADIDAIAFQPFLDRQAARDFDASMMAVAADPSPATIKQNWTTSGITGGQNFINYSNPKFDALVDSGQHSFDPARARSYYHRAYETIVADAPAVFLYDFLLLGGTHRRLRMPPLRADGWWTALADFTIPANERIERDRIGLRPAQP